MDFLKFGNGFLGVSGAKPLCSVVHCVNIQKYFLANKIPILNGKFQNIDHYRQRLLGFGFAFIEFTPRHATHRERMRLEEGDGRGREGGWEEEGSRRPCHPFKH